MSTTFVPVLDVTQALDMLDQDTELYQQVLEIMLLQLDEYDSELGQASPQEHERVRQISHKIKGGCAGIAAEEARACAGLLEQRAKNAEPIAGADLQNLQACLQRLRLAIQQHLAA